MADRDNTPVKVTLDRQRPYRVNDTDTSAVMVGPGDVEVPAWVAQEWGLTANNQTASKPKTTRASVPADAVSQTTETVKEEPLQTTETVKVDDQAKGGKAA
jgi:hypothetical protein